MVESEYKKKIFNQEELILKNNIKHIGTDAWTNEKTHGKKFQRIRCLKTEK